MPLLKNLSSPLTLLNPTASLSEVSCPSTMRRNATSSSRKRSTSVFVDSCSHLQQDSFKAIYMSVSSNGDADINLVQSGINPDTRLVSVMAVSNEIGMVQPVEEMREICRELFCFMLMRFRLWARFLVMYRRRD